MPRSLLSTEHGWLTSHRVSILFLLIALINTQKGATKPADHVAPFYIGRCWTYIFKFSTECLRTQHLMEHHPLMLLECTLQTVFADQINFSWVLRTLVLVYSIWSIHGNDAFVKGNMALVRTVFKYGLRSQNELWYGTADGLVYANLFLNWWLNTE